MKNSLACPKCESRTLWRIEDFRTGPEFGGELPVAAWRMAGIVGKRVGRFEAFVCSQCGYTEFWATSIEELQPKPRKGIHFIDTTPQQSEYR